MANSKPNFDPSETPMESLIKLSRYYGSDLEFVIAGGGNTSVKIDNVLYVKASGFALSGITADGFVELDRVLLGQLLARDLGEDVDRREELFKNSIMAARLHPEKNQRPSVESVLHHLLPKKFVVHTHSTFGNMFTCGVNGQKALEKLFGDKILWTPFVDPGFVLAKTIHKMLKEYQRQTGLDCPLAVMMQNHGLIICGDTPQEVLGNTDLVISTLKKEIDITKNESPFGEVKPVDALRARELTMLLAPALRGLLSREETLKIVTFDDSHTAMKLAAGAEGKKAAMGGPLTPDQIVYCKSMPLWLEISEDESSTTILNRLKSAVKDFETTYKYLPQVVIVQGVGIFSAGDSYLGANSIRQVYLDAINVMTGALQVGGIHYMTERDRRFIEHWEVESYRRKILAASKLGRAVGKIAVVTGAAQGFGLEIAQDFASQGAHVALLDINVQGAQTAAHNVCAPFGAGKAIGLECNVTSADSIENAIYHIVRTFGGIDVFVSNAGVLKAESVKSQPEKDFDFVTAVNYKGYFLCVQKVAPVMEIQHRVRPDYWSDIIQINSKSGLVGSNKNGAYAGSKFGGIGLTQSFAMELVEDGIKVNSICPGNFFDGPLWSDPNNGLFMQYLRTGKVPGATTIEDVRRSYEVKVPMKRGCTTPDVMKAIYYIMEQKYETGQAVPVTGGQVMLN